MIRTFQFKYWFSSGAPISIFNVEAQNQYEAALVALERLADNTKAIPERTSYWETTR